LRTRLLPPLGLLLALAVTVSSGCAWRKAPQPAETAAPAPEPIEATPPAPAAAPTLPPPAVPAPPPLASRETAPAVSAAERAYAGGMAALQEGGTERALDLFSAALKEKPGYPEASRAFDETLVALKKQGDAAYTQGKAEEAGKRWMNTLRHINHASAKGKSYPFTRAEVQGQVDRLTAAQMEKGLLNYRKGDIPAAIASWKTIIAYDPENEEATRSIRTASTQLENLKKIPAAQ
jgi:tetratricopeptide (TPR) repeat protein